MASVEIDPPIDPPRDDCYLGCNTFWPGPSEGASMNRILVLGVSVVLAASCGGGDDDSADAATDERSADTTAQTASSGDSESDPESESESTTTPTTAAAPASGDAVSGIGSASVTIEGATYYFGETSAPAPQCKPDLFGVYLVNLPMVDEGGNEIPSGGRLSLVLLRDGVDPDEVDQLPEAALTIAELDEEWIANEEALEMLGLEVGTSQIDSYTIDGNTASGTATLYEQNSYYAFLGGSADSVSTTQGTFEVTCRGD